jgi:hypothetical protein
MVVKRIRLPAMWLCGAGMLASCASTRLIADIQEPGYRGGPIESALVIAIADNPQTRQTFEDAFVQEFRRRGLVAHAGLDALNPGTPTSPEAMEPAAKQLGVEAVFTACLLESKEERIYTAPIYYERQYIRGTTVYAYSPTMTGYVFREGYYTTYRYYTPESTLSSVQTGGRIWSAGSETEDPEPAERAIADLAKAVADNLKKHGLLP